MTDIDFASFYRDDLDFKNYGIEHLVAVVYCVLFCAIVLYLAKYKWTEKQSQRFIIFVAAFVLFTQLFKVFIRMILGNFHVTEDLPLHLCNLMPFFMLYVVYTKNRFWWSIFFFWIMAGTLQSLFTPTLTEYMPHYEAIRYWIVHSGLPLLAIYGYYIYGWQPTMKDALISGIALNILALIMYPINLLLGSNYVYLNGKPPGTTLYSYLGPWPYYIISLEFVWIIMFSLLVLIFRGISKMRGINPTKNM
ncbi:MAG TPA: TIGR02206 family membrane protein [Saprospiraceae bacterium]|nr:TIGR02206 family membrane protein [Saprospiraceae bacterium]MCB9328233.1 TIGR02206 family membrane protein [Lewinellaceae bacterium]HPK09978.1 TIGR02206 family membrane protein [Saprospiraceae bacterium]HRX28790.1 TIGR02206 family membrane protein [Saprospiraceae bacterium]